MAYPSALSYPQPGTVVSVPKGPFIHYGIVTDTFVDGMPTVITNSLRAGGVVDKSVSHDAGSEKRSRPDSQGDERFDQPLLKFRWGLLRRNGLPLIAARY